jgi:hypothetical protein
MKSKPKHDAITSHNDTRRSVTRCLIDDPVKGWQLFGVQRAMEAYKGHLSLPKYAGRTLRIAFAYIDAPADNTLPPRLVRMECNEWVLDAVGNVSQGIVQAEIVKKIDPVAGPIDFSMLGYVQVTAQDMAAILKCLGIPIG